MSFDRILNDYIAQLACTARELSDVSGLSAAVISRYRAGERVPAADSDQLRQLAHGIAVLAVDRQLKGLSESDVAAALSAPLSQKSTDRQRLTENLNALFGVLDINLTELSHALNYDASYLSRIRSGQRRPSDVTAFSQRVAGYVVSHYSREVDRAALAELIGDTTAELTKDDTCLMLLARWLCNGQYVPDNSVSTFLHKLDDFNLNEYIRSIHFDELKVPSVPFQLPNARSYFGLEEMKAGELDFFRATVLSKSTEPVLMCSDMPLEDMAADLEFSKKWMFGLAMILKKNLHLNMIHNLDRPFGEMMLGLESWIPLYMTGQISPYYLVGAGTSVYHHTTYVSGSAALSGECIDGFHADARYTLTNHREEVAYFQRKAAYLLKKARPLMDIYRKESENVYQAFLRADVGTAGKRRGLLSTPPIYTLPVPLLTQILRRNHLSEEDTARILSFAARQRELIETVLSKNVMTDEIARLSEEEFTHYPVTLSLSGLFYEQDVTYTFADYQEHLHSTEEYAAAHPNYTVKMTDSPAFRNIQILFHEEKWVMLSKTKSPAIHFVIRHPKLCRAMENMIVPVTENWTPNDQGEPFNENVSAKDQ